MDILLIVMAKATTSDAEIMSGLFSSGISLRSYFREDYVFILDKGFRDSLSLLEGCGFRKSVKHTIRTKHVALL